MRELTCLSLFSGIGGIDLAAEAAGFRTVGFIEIDPFCQKVLRKHWPDVPIWSDIRDVTAGFLEAAGITAVDLLHGGFPCQPHSVAGKRQASTDERDLWPEFARIIREVNPRWVLGENVPGLLSSEVGRFFGRVLRDLAAMGYDAGWCVYGAGDVGAPHRRERVFIVASRGVGQADATGRLRNGCGVARNGRLGPPNGSEIVADAAGFERREPNEKAYTFSNERQARAVLGSGGRILFTDNRPPESRLGGVFDGLPRWLDRPWPAGPNSPQYDWEPPRTATGIRDRVSRLKALGNAVVPAQVYPLLQAIADQLRAENQFSR